MIIQGKNYTQAEGKRVMQEIIKQHEYSEIPLSSWPGKFVMDLLSNHQNFTEKCGNGVKRILVEKDKYGKNFCIKFERLDDTKVEISWHKALGTKKDYLKINVHSALRTAIKDQTNDFRSNFFENNTNPKCRITKELLTRNNCHVNHVHPSLFENLVKDWLISNNLEIVDVKIKDCGQFYEMDDSEQLKSWQPYHLKNAVLEVLSKTGNLRLGNRAV